MSERDDRLVAGALNRALHESAVLGVVFAGGTSRRYGRDKLSSELHGIPLLRHVANRFGPQVNRLAISGPPRPGFPYPSIPDQLPGAGPLGALRSVLQLAVQRDWRFVATVSGDTPFIPRDMVSGLSAALKWHDCAVASRNGILHPTCAVWATRACAKIEAGLNAGARSLRRAVSHLDAVEVNFSAADDAPRGDPFFNINSVEDMAVAQAWLTGRGRTE